MTVSHESDAALRARGLWLLALGVTAFFGLAAMHRAKQPRSVDVAEASLQSTLRRPDDLTNRSPSHRCCDAYLADAAEETGLPLELLRAVASVESNFNPRAVSPKGAIGVMQLMPSTARSLGVRDPYDPRENVLGGARYLKALYVRWNGDLTLTVASYNAGPFAVARNRGVPPYRETQRYVQRVLQRYHQAIVGVRPTPHGAAYAVR